MGSSFGRKKNDLGFDVLLFAVMCLDHDACMYHD